VAPGASAAPEIDLPIWFPSANLPQEVSNAGESPNPLFITCRENVLDEIRRLGISKIAEVYAELFNALWEMGRKKRRVQGRSVYAKMTPPWLQQNVIFIHGANGNVSLPFTHGVLPRKKQIKDRKFQFIGEVILDTILQKEELLAPYLLYLLREAGMSIPANAFNPPFEIEVRNSIATSGPIPTEALGDVGTPHAHDRTGNMK